MTPETKERITKLESDMIKSIDSLKKELAKRRTGQANTALLDGIVVDYYGTPSPLSQISSLQVPDSRTILIKAWDKTALPLIEKAITQSSLGLNPSTDGDVIRVPIPALTGERRTQLVKEVKKIGEESKVALRNQRREANDAFKKRQKNNEITEDDLKKVLVEVQNATDKHIKVVDDVVLTKEKQILED